MSGGRVLAIVVLVFAILVGITSAPVPLWLLLAALAAAVAIG